MSAVLIQDRSDRLLFVGQPSICSMTPTLAASGHKTSVVCRAVLWSGPTRQQNVAASSAVQQGRQPLQADECGEHRHRHLHLVRPLWAQDQHHGLPPGDQEA